MSRYGLTEAEHDALVQAVGEHCHHTGPVVPSLPHGCRDCDGIVRTDVAETVARIVAAREADAWDAGFENGIDDGFIADNPHRDAPTEPIAYERLSEETPDA
ncbi:MAG: hypothetical protein ACRDTJ_31375 [Pseudonocardiaceae bacterium]